jgi:drug/metabolite transporter (DMT)-like permease
MAVLFWATAASAFKLSLQYLAPPMLLLYSSTTACLCLMVILLVTGRQRQYRAWRGADLIRSAVMGFLNPFAYYLILLEAYDRLPAQQAQPLNFVWPIVLVLLSVVVLRQRPSLWTLPAMALSFTGVVVIATRGEFTNWQSTDPVGVALALASTVIWALYWIFGIRDKHDPVNRLCLNFAFGTVFTLIFIASTDALMLPPLPGLAGAVYVGLFEMGLTFVLWLRALQLSRTTAEVSGLIYLTPFVSLMLIAGVLGESIHPSTVIGLILIVGGILVQQYAGRFRADVGAA